MYTVTYADARRDQYAADIDAANAYYRETADLAGYQGMARTARDTWHADIRAHYADAAIEDAYTAARMDAAANGGRVYADLDTGERVRVPSVAYLYEVTDIAGAPAAPVIARMVGGFTVLHTTVADLVSRA